MTPDEARALLDGTTPGSEWYYRVKWGAVQYIEPVTVIPGGDVDVTEDDAALIVAAPEMAAMIAGMRAQYGLEVRRPGGEWVPPYSWHDSPEQAENCVTPLHGWGDTDRRVVRRYVTTPEEA